ncbi:MAG: hypothetical protein JKY65_31655 [Planctomycetes bacterium]|nr:hypothetical protein [Planctomycetota bacterium]
MAAQAALCSAATSLKDGLACLKRARRAAGDVVHLASFEGLGAKKPALTEVDREVAPIVIAWAFEGSSPSQPLP